MRRAALILAILLLGASVSHAHTRWADGSPVPAWIMKACCGPSDVHHLRPDQVELRDDGYHVEGYPDPIPVREAMASQDGDYWAFYHEFLGGQKTRMYCLFVPFSGA